MRRVVITGAGAITPLGNDLESFFEKLLAGESAAGPITRFDPKDIPSRIAAEVVDFDSSAYMDAKEARRMDLYAQYAVAASVLACQQARVDQNSFDPQRCGVLIASGIGGINTLLEQYLIFLEKGARKVSPFLIPMMIPDIASALVSIRYNLRGANYAIASACASGAHAIGESFLMVRDGRADAMITGGAEAPLHPLAFAGFCSARALTTRNDDPKRASRPFDKDRDGFLIGEGAGIIVIEELEHARRRGAPILAEILGYAATGDAYHITAPHEEGLGAIESMRKALEDAQIKPADVDYINSHGTSTPTGDVAECRAIAKVFGENGKKPIVNSTKSMIGHLLGAAGAVELIVCMMSLRTGWIHPSINIDNLDEGCSSINIAMQKVELKPIIALSNSFGFGGHNATIILRKWQE